MSANWKNLVRKVARTIKGKRNIREDFSQSMSDVSHPLLFVECKYRKKISGFLKDGLRQGRDIILIRYRRSDFQKIIMS